MAFSYDITLLLHKNCEVTLSGPAMNNFLHIKKHKDNSEQNSLPPGIQSQNKGIYLNSTEHTVHWNSNGKII